MKKLLDIKDLKLVKSRLSRRSKLQALLVELQIEKDQLRRLDYLCVENFQSNLCDILIVTEQLCIKNSK